MSFLSINFILFCLILFLVYFSIPKKYQWVVLLVFSYIFYMCAGVKLVLFLLATTFSTYYAGLIIGKRNVESDEYLKKHKAELTKDQKKEYKENVTKQKRRIMIYALLFNFGILLILKYSAFISGPLNALYDLMSIDYRIPELKFILPLGISFYTFQSIAYVVDIHRGKFEPEKNFAKFALFVSFFPQLIQGPISRFDELAFQFYEEHKFDYKKFKFGIELMVWGYFKKMIISDRIAIVTDAIFSNPTRYQGFYILFAAVLSWIELYIDFSGGIDIARGVAEALGITMPENFKRPFFADSLAEFWRRWHMSLNNWWRDYIFYPLTLSKAFQKLGQKTRTVFGNEAGKKMPMMLALLIVRFVNSVWHGAYIIYLLGGLYHGILIALAFLLEPWFKKLVQIFKVNTEAFSWKLFKIVRTFILICIPRIFYTANSFGEVILYIKAAFAKFNPWIFFDGSLSSFGVTDKQWDIIGFGLLVVLIASIFQEKGYCIREKLEEQNIGFRWLVYIATLAALAVFGVYGIGYDAAGFAYMNF